MAGRLGSAPRGRLLGAAHDRCLSIAVTLVVSSMVGGCGTHHHASSNPFVKPGKPLVEMGQPLVLAKESGKPRHPIEMIRPASSASWLPTVETSDPGLSAALLKLAIAPTSDAHRRVAERYRALGILDMAYDHFQRAAQLDRTDAAAYEGLARVWRDWGFPGLGIPDASRAVYYAPASASTHNTLGTLLAALGDEPDARREYERAVQIDPRAAYALNNLCSLSFLTGHLAAARAECQAALAVNPALAAARDTLAVLESRGARDRAR